MARDETGAVLYTNVHILLTMYLICVTVIKVRLFVKQQLAFPQDRILVVLMFTFIAKNNTYAYTREYFDSVWNTSINH